MSSSSSPCAACKFLRRKCTQECVFAPYFPPDKPLKFANVHRVFGASNVAKLLNELNPAQREDAVNSLAFEADARLRDPVNGCVGMISILQQKLKLLQIDLSNAKKELAAYIGPQAMLPMLQPNNTATAATYISQEAMAGGGGLNHSSYVVPYNIGPMMGIPTVGGAAISQVAPQIGPPVQMFETRSAISTMRPDQQEIYRAYQQQQQEEVKFESRGLNGVVEAVPGSTGYSQMNGGVMSPSLALGIYDNTYHIQPQQQQTEQELYTGNHQQHHLHSQLLLQPQHTQASDHPTLPQQQQQQQSSDHHHQRSDSEERKSAGLSC